MIYSLSINNLQLKLPREEVIDLSNYSLLYFDCTYHFIIYGSRILFCIIRLNSHLWHEHDSINFRAKFLAWFINEGKGRHSFYILVFRISGKRCQYLLNHFSSQVLQVLFAFCSSPLGHSVLAPLSIPTFNLLF